VSELYQVGETAPLADDATATAPYDAGSAAASTLPSDSTLFGLT
jgi:hypothetical protein